MKSKNLFSKLIPLIVVISFLPLNSGLGEFKRDVFSADTTGTTPIANFTGDPTSGPAPLEVQFTDSSTGSPTGWAWYFGDEILDNSWTQMPRGAEWTARSGHTSVVLADGSILVMGGYSGETYADQLFNDVWRSTDQGATWMQIIAAAPWTARHDHTSVVLSDGSIVLMGGIEWGGEYNKLNDVWCSTDQGATWTLMTAAAAWEGRYDHTTVVLPDGSIVLMGGELEYYEQSNDVWRSTDKGATWTQMTAAAPWTARSGHTSVVLPDGSIVLMGGSGRNDVWRSIDKGATWTQMTAAAPWTARRDHTSVVLSDGSIVLMGGNYYLNDVWCSTDQGATWTQITAAAPWKGREGHTSVALADGSIVLMGGYFLINYPDEFALNDIWRSTDQGASWTLMTTPAYWAITGCDNSVALPDGSIVLMGRFYDGDYLNEVWRSTDQGATWAQMTTAAPWTGRTDHTSVALPDGSIVLMGGFDGSLLNDVWRSTDQGATWTQMTAAAPWTARDSHTSVVLLDGSIVLMGGYDGSRRNDVWRSTDQGATWTQMTTAASWGERIGHTSVALPDGSIVLMGGHDGSYCNDIWRSTDQGATWAMINPASPWHARIDHTSVVLPDGSIVLMGGQYTIVTTIPTIYILSDIWRSTDQGETWSWISNGNSFLNQQRGITTLPDGSIVLVHSDGVQVWRLETAGSTEQHPTHIYTEPGIYSVALQVYNTDGYSRLIRDGYINVYDGPPAPAITIDPEEITSNQAGDVIIHRDLEIGNTGGSNLNWAVYQGTVGDQLILPLKTTTAIEHGSSQKITIGDDMLAFSSHSAEGTSGSLPLPEIDADRVSLTHSISQTITSGNSVACSSDGGVTTYANQYLRTFSLADFGITQAFAINQVSFGIENLSATRNITVNLYTLNGAFTYANLTKIGTTTTSLAAQSLSLVNVPISVFAPAGSTLVVEVAAGNFSGEAAFFIGSNALGETAPSYFSSAACSLPEPVEFASIGFPNTHIVMSVTGEVMDPLICDAPSSVDWVDVTPLSGVVSPAGYQVMDVAFDSTGLAVDTYTANLCLTSNDPAHPLSVIPLSLTVQAAPAPSVISITPNSGENTGTIPISIIGGNFVSGATVKLTRAGQPDINGTSVNVVNAGQITCNLNLAGAATGLWNVVVTNPDTQSGTLTNGFTVTSPPLPAPSVISITPNSGENTTTIPVSISGGNFVSGATVKLTRAGQPDINGTSVIVVNAGQITCNLNLAGAATGLWNVVVTNPDTQSGTLTNGFTVTSPPPPAPSVISITPNSGENTGTLAVSISGGNFVPGATVKLTRAGQPDINGTSVIVVNAGQITCNLNLAGAVTGTWNVIVTNPDTQSGTLTNGFTVTSPPLPAPSVISITPNSGENTGTLAVSISGANFVSGATVKLTRSGQPDINGTSVIVVNAGQITCNLNLAGVATGLWNVVVTNPDIQSGTLTNCFTVTGTQMEWNIYLPLILK